MSLEPNDDASIRASLDKDVCPECGSVIATYAGGGKACTNDDCDFWWVW